MTNEEARAVCQRAMLAIPVLRATCRGHQADLLAEAVRRCQQAIGRNNRGDVEQWARAAEKALAQED